MIFISRLNFCWCNNCQITIFPANIQCINILTVFVNNMSTLSTMCAFWNMYNMYIWYVSHICAEKRMWQWNGNYMKKVSLAARAYFLNCWIKAPRLGSLYCRHWIYRGTISQNIDPSTTTSEVNFGQTFNSGIHLCRALTSNGRATGVFSERTTFHVTRGVSAIINSPTEQLRQCLDRVTRCNQDYNCLFIPEWFQ